MRQLFQSITLAFSLMAASATANPGVELRYEVGPTAILQNDGRYGANGTAYGADDVGQTSNLVIGQRASVELALDCHRLVLLYAPFAVSSRFVPREDFFFRDSTFDAGAALVHDYLFDGYRASYLGRVLDGPLSLELGASLQVRNANVAFTSGNGEKFSSESDIGLVFALKARLTWASAPGAAWAQVEADAFSTFGAFESFRGGIYDVALTLGIPMGEAADLLFVTRFLGGGAEVRDREIENWANFFSTSIGLRLRIDTLIAQLER